MNSPSTPNAANWYLASIASFMIPAGIQMVLLPYLLAIELNQPASRFGLSQMIGQLPILAFLLVGGLLADRLDARRMLIWVHAGAIVMPALLAVAVWKGQLSEPLLVVYALCWGLASAFAMPARDGLLRRVAGTNVQRMVTLAIGVQFATQMLGQAAGGRAGHWGTISVLMLQCLVLMLGIFVASRLPKAAPAAAPVHGSIWRELAGGFSTILASPPMRATLPLTIGMGVFFGGVFLVLMPLAIRDLYQGSAQDLATGYLVFGIGTLLMVSTLMKRGGARRPGRALIISQYGGALILLPIVFAPPLWLFFVLMFIWGMGGGLAMTMSRTIIQEHTPASHQSRAMAVLSLATAGGGPIGSMLLGFAVSAWGVQIAALVPVVGVTLITTAVLSGKVIWSITSSSRKA